MEEYDFLVIGSGSGLDVANVAANQGQSVAVIEKGRLGGTCLNRGCIPSKKLLYHADVMETIERADEFGIDATIDDVAFADIVRDVTDDVHGSSDSIRRGLHSSDRIDLYEAKARFVDERTVSLSGGSADGARLRADTVLVAAGTRPAIPKMNGLEDVEYLTSTEALTVETLPDRLVIVGGGYIAAELAQFFGTFGSDVAIISRRPTMLPDADEEVSAAFTDRYADRFDVHTGYEAVAVSKDHGSISVEARAFTYPDSDANDSHSGTANRDDRITVAGDELLIATGRVPNSDTLNLEAAGIETDADGFIQTDEYLRTTADGVWALGDIVGEYLLKHNANHEARSVARTLFGDDLEPIDYSAMPFAVFASPEVAGVGLTEQELRASDREYATRVYPYDETARGSAMHAEGFVKSLIDLEGGILGCHIIGPDASNLIQEVVVAMTAGSGTVGDISQSVHIHPALSEVVQRAFSGQFTRRGDHDHDHDHEHPH
ncbi:dihydrolipoyl dehydrogenase [Natrinema gelatinilyticum]|uniref:dihydrolipoyl dehydrogenase n=1 Tax=Natrinema gelatinilyticum TaxID=2961571 RepID=UPI0020C25813|nr:dihydrolipoyl dehydrogenase [Natrinema gelatinilyticum]